MSHHAVSRSRTGNPLRGWRSRPVGSPFPRHGTLSRRGFEPRSCTPKAQLVVRWIIGSHGPPSFGSWLAIGTTGSDCATATEQSRLRVSSRGRTSGNPGNTTPDHVGCRPCRARHRRYDPERSNRRSVPTSMSIPTWLSHASTPSECVPTSTRSAPPPEYAGRLALLVFRAQPRFARLDADAGI